MRPWWRLVTVTFILVVISPILLAVFPGSWPQAQNELILPKKDNKPSFGLTFMELSYIWSKRLCLIPC